MGPNVPSPLHLSVTCWPSPRERKSVPEHLASQRPYDLRSGSRPPEWTWCTRPLTTSIFPLYLASAAALS